MKVTFLVPCLVALIGVGCASPQKQILTEPTPAKEQPATVQTMVSETTSASVVPATSSPATLPTHPAQQPSPQPISTPPPQPTPTPTPTHTPPPAPTPQPKTVSVSIHNFAFDPVSISVKRGDSILIINQDNAGHTATADQGAFNSPMLEQGQSFRIDTETLPVGTYAYHCGPHPFMKGTIVIN